MLLTQFILGNGCASFCAASTTSFAPSSATTGASGRLDEHMALAARQEKTLSMHPRQKCRNGGAVSSFSWTKKLPCGIGASMN